MKQTNLLKTFLLLCALIVGSTCAWADTDVTINFGTADGCWSADSKASYTDSDSRTWSRSYSAGNKSSGQAGYSQFGNSSNACTSLVFTATAGSDMTVTAFSVKMAGASGGSSPTTGTIYLYKVSGENETELASASVSGTSDVTCSITSNQDFSSTDVLKVSYVGTAKAIRVKQLTYSYTSGGGGSSDPSISASNVNIAQDATSGSIEYTLNNATGNVSASITTGDWLTLGTITSSAVPFTCSANTGAQRTATVTLSFTGATDKVVIITQAPKTVASPEYNLEGGSYMQGTNITITSEGNTIYYNLTTDGSTPANPTNASTEYTGPIALGSGTTKIKAIAYDTYGNASSVVTRTYTGIALASLPFSWTGTETTGKEDLAGQTGVALNLGGDYAASNAPYRLKFDGTSKYVTIYTNEKPEIVYFTAKLFNAASTGSKIKVQGSADGITFTDIEEFTIKGSANQTFEFATSNAFAATHRVVKLTMSSKDQNVAVGTICVSCIPLTPAKTYTTLTSKYALDFTSVSSDLKAFIATEISGDKVQMVQVNKVPAGTGLVLKATTPGDAVNVPVFDGTGADDVAANKMAGSATETTAIAANGGYILSNGVFQPASAGTLAAGKAYLNIAVSSARSLEMSFDDVTAIETVKAEKANNEYFNLAGQRVAQPTKGLYIVNGKKVVIK